MVGRKRSAAPRGSRRKANDGNDGPGIYQEMLAEAGVAASAGEGGLPNRPLKRRRGLTGKDEKATELAQGAGSGAAGAQEEEDESEDEDVEFQDVELPAPTVQTMELESEDDEDEDEDEDMHFENVNFTSPLKSTEPSATEPQNLELNLTAHQSNLTPTKRAPERRKPLTKEERERRVEVHKLHLLCLLSHVARRNHWCNDAKAQDYLRPHLTDKMVKYLNPGTNLSQFGRSESLRNGLGQVDEVWKAKFEVTERGVRRALWAEDVEQLQDYELPSDMESCLDREDFREAAKRLQGSRDMGAQLYCALLRSVGVRTRLVCSLQPLSCHTGAPNMPKPTAKKASQKSLKNEEVHATIAKYEKMADSTAAGPSGGSTARRRLGHPSATAYNFQPTASPPKRKPEFHTPVRIRESTYPVYWVEVLDVGHQKWQPVDPIVTHTFWKPKAFEPAITDKENCMSYVVAFEADGTAKDVTRRYAKAYTAKTRKLRVENAAEGGQRWWAKAIRLYRPRWPDDLDQIEENELTGVEAREPMPRNVQDFKDHPVYALERHIRRHEVLVPEATPSGTIAAGSRGPLEKIYRRKDVRVVRSGDKWYRMGREVKPNEIPAKWLPKRAPAKHSRFGDREDEDEQGDVEVPMYRLDQTDEFEPPPVRNGRVPRNKFGNIDVYVPSMVPRGGVHIRHPEASRAAYLLGVDYAPALTGFDFRGRHGTAVLSGVVVAEEVAEGVEAVLAGLGDLRREVEEDRRRGRALRGWRRLLMGLRIRERVWRGVEEEGEGEGEKGGEIELEEEGDGDEQMDDGESDVTEEFDMVVDEDEHGDGQGVGGFMADDGEDGGGFVVD